VASPNSLLSSLEDYGQRLIRLATVLVDMHLDVAIQEANYEKRRLIGGFIMLGIAIGLLTMAIALLQVLGILIAHLLGLSWIWATSTVISCDIIIGGIFAAAARMRLSGPLMARTQARLARSVSMLRTGTAPPNDSP
jgi:uncharacterized membrane protein YqjE